MFQTMNTPSVRGRMTGHADVKMVRQSLFLIVLRDWLGGRE